MMERARGAFLWVAVLAVAAGCQPAPGDPGKVDAGHLDAGAPDAGPVDAGAPDAGPTLYSDFPSNPILDDTQAPPPSNAPALFGAPDAGTSSGGPCLVEPEVGSLFPMNWLRPRFKLSAPPGQNLFEIRLSAPDQTNELVVYTTRTTWTMPASIWSTLSRHSIDVPITVTVRGAVFDGTQLTSGPMRGSSGELRIAPAVAAGTIVYWTTSGGTQLKGFSIGQESVQTVLTPNELGVGCVGCHTSTPDGKYAAISAAIEPASGDPARIELRSLDGTASEPPFLTSDARALLGRTSQQFPAFSPKHWAPGDRLAISMLRLNSNWELIWTDLEATSQAQGVGWDIIAAASGSSRPGAPTFSHDGTKILYHAAPTMQSGTNAIDGGGDLYVVPFTNRTGGTPAKVPGASEPAFNEYYPTYSPDDAWIAFNRVPNDETSYDNPNAEVFVLPASGGTPTRLAANDPPTCGGKTSPGVKNSWPKWSPKASTVGSRTYYWLTFSSTRAGSHPQLYVAPVVVEGSTVKSYPALNLWNQPEDEANHTPAWDMFEVGIGARPRRTPLQGLLASVVCAGPR